MEIVKERSGGAFHLRLTGRLDNHWSQPLDDTLQEVLREGARHMRLDLSGVSYLSTAGVTVLLKGYRDAAALQGSFQISAASDRVRDVLRQMSLDRLFLAGPAGSDLTRRRTLSVPLPLESERASFASRELDGGPSELFVAGDPTRLPTDSYEEAHSQSITAHKDLFALGVGALGASYDECRSLFGEFIAAAGSAAYMPTDGTATPDYMASSDELVPEIRALYALGFRGSPTHQLRFEATTPGTAVPLSEIVDACVSLAGTTDVGIVMSAEVAGLVCARLRRSPAQSAAARFDFPSIREWLSFTPEREFARFSGLIVGVASTSPSASIAPFLRPLGEHTHGHFHAAVTAFRSMKPGKLEIANVVGESLQTRSVFSVVHLLRDARPEVRPIGVAGESEFERGTCWVFPIGGARS